MNLTAREPRRSVPRGLLSRTHINRCPLFMPFVKREILRFSRSLTIILVRRRFPRMRIQFPRNYEEEMRPRHTRAVGNISQLSFTARSYRFYRHAIYTRTQVNVVIYHVERVLNTRISLNYLTYQTTRNECQSAWVYY